MRDGGAGLTRITGAGFPPPRGLPDHAGSYVPSTGLISWRATPGHDGHKGREIAAFTSRSSTRPHASHRKIRSHRSSVAFAAPQWEQLFELGKNV